MMRVMMAVFAGCVACGGSVFRDGTEGNQAAEFVEPELTVEELGQSWRELPAASAQERPVLVHTPDGFFALSREGLGTGKAQSGIETYLYRSSDGVWWQRLDLGQPGPSFSLRDMAYGLGLLALVGDGGDRTAVWTSRDGASWNRIPIAIDGPGLHRIAFAGGRFFALSGLTQIASSGDGTHWQTDTLDTVMPMDVAAGHGVYLLVGNGPIQRSLDGESFQPLSLDCSLPQSCQNHPDGTLKQAFHSRVVFDGVRFNIEGLSSEDGLDWFASTEPTPQAIVGGYLMAWRAGSGGTQLEAWKPGVEPSVIDIEPASATLRIGDGVVPDSLEAPQEDGASCATHHCVVFDDRLFLIP